MTLTAAVESAQLAELLEQVQAGHEVLLTRGGKAVAKLMPVVEKEAATKSALRVRSLKGRQVLPRAISQAKPAEEIFVQQ